MSIAISSALSTASVAAANAPSTAAVQQEALQQVQQQAQQQVQQSASASADTVTLTAAQQVYNLYNQGQTVSQISTSLSLPVSTVNNYLGITQTSS
jgi:DNA-binding NarL/FixJ family response regulator